MFKKTNILLDSISSGVEIGKTLCYTVSSNRMSGGDVMEKILTLCAPERVPVSYPRAELKKDVLYAYYRYKDVDLGFSKVTGKTTRVTDRAAAQMLELALTDKRTVEAYTAKVCETLCDIREYDDLSAEQLYETVSGVRRRMLGAEALEKLRCCRADNPVTFDPADGGIDQREKKAQLLESCGAVLFVLCQAQFKELLCQDVNGALSKGKAVYIAVSKEEGRDLPTRQVMGNWLGEISQVTYLEAEPEKLAWDKALQETVDKKNACLFFYGEEGLLHCRSLLTDAVVHAIPKGFHAQALTNLLGTPKACAVYVPAGWDMTRFVRLKDRTRVSFWQLERLWRDHGDSIYQKSVEQMYRDYPRYFLNIYDKTGEDWPIYVDMSADGEDPLQQYDAARDKAIKRYLDGFENITYYSAYFDPEMNRQSICWDSSQKQEGVLVQGVRVKRSQGAQVVQCGKGVTLRQKFAAEPKEETAIVSNFLFFLTPKLGVLYNDLRADRPYEQADAAAGHLDYMLCHQEGKRIETFPLFRKTCIAMKEDGQFLFFNYRLGGGSIRVNGKTLRWEKEQVDRPDPHAPITVFSPYYSLSDEDADRQTYRTLVGEGRINLVILQDKLCALRDGDVVLPSVGVAVSLERKEGEKLIQELGLKPLEDGYYDVSGLSLTVKLDGPEQIDPREWETVRWAYGGGLSLILDGVGLCDGDHMDTWFQEDGWKSPLSRQTQESALHTLVKHPRTAIGITENGELVILVFSGRTWRSTGADYDQMCQIARQLCPDIRWLMNVDGGGSAMLGMVRRGSFMELSCPSTSSGSLVGMVRPINTVLYIPAGTQA